MINTLLEFNIIKFILYFSYMIIFHLRLSRPKQTKASIVIFDIFTHINFKLLNMMLNNIKFK